MTPMDLSAAQAVLTRYLEVLAALTRLSEEESRLLDRPDAPLPQGLVERKDALVQDYAMLTGAMKARAHALYAAGLLDLDDVERRVRHLVTLMKDNQRKLTIRKAITAQRVDMVMRALAEREQAAAAGPVAPLIHSAPTPPIPLERVAHSGR